MRIAISGTHCVGKSTLIDEFLRAHPSFVHEPEPYAVLVEDYGEEFSSEPNADDFYRQLEFHVERLITHFPGERVIYERSPLDYLAYIRALEDLGRETLGPTFMESVEKKVADALNYLDLIVFLSVEEQIEVSEEEDLDLRIAVDASLPEFFNLEDFGSVTVVFANGSTSQRLQTIEAAISHGISKTHPLDGSQRMTS